MTEEEGGIEVREGAPSSFELWVRKKELLQRGLEVRVSRNQPLTAALYRLQSVGDDPSLPILSFLAFSSTGPIPCRRRRVMAQGSRSSAGYRKLLPTDYSSQCNGH